MVFWNYSFHRKMAYEPSRRVLYSYPYQYAVSPHCCTAVQFNSVIVPYPHHFPHYTGAVWGVSRDVPSDSGSPAINIRIDTQWYSGYYPYITGCVGSGLPPSDAAGYRPASEARNKRRVFCLRYNQHTNFLCNNKFFHHNKLIPSSLFLQYLTVI